MKINLFVLKKRSWSADKHTAWWQAGQWALSRCSQCRSVTSTPDRDPTRFTCFTSGTDTDTSELIKPCLLLLHQRHRHRHKWTHKALSASASPVHLSLLSSLTSNRFLFLLPLLLEIKLLYYYTALYISTLLIHTCMLVYYCDITDFTPNRNIKKWVVEKIQRLIKYI